MESTTTTITLTCNKTESTIGLSITIGIGGMQVNYNFDFARDIDYVVSFEKTIDWNKNWAIERITDEDSSNMNYIKYNANTNSLKFQVVPHMGGGSSFTITANHYVREKMEEMVDSILGRLYTRIDYEGFL